MQRPDSGGFDGIPITDITEREWDTWLDSPDKPSTQQSSEAATAPPPSQLPGDANHKIALLEEQIGKLQQNLVQEQYATSACGPAYGLVSVLIICGHV